MENEYNRKLPYLDIVVDLVNNEFNTSVYRIPTFSCQGLSFFSHCGSYISEIDEPLEFNENMST